MAGQGIRGWQTWPKKYHPVCKKGLALLQDKINSFWSISKVQIQELNAQLRGKDREAEDAETRHEVETKVWTLNVD